MDCLFVRLVLWESGSSCSLTFVIVFEWFCYPFAYDDNLQRIGVLSKLSLVSVVEGCLLMYLLWRSRSVRSDQNLIWSCNRVWETSFCCLGL
jgi:hypothetical protein